MRAQATITDCFDIRPNLPHVDHAPGFVMFLRGDAMPTVGTELAIPTVDGTTVTLPVLEVKWFGDSCSVFIGRQLGRQVTVGTAVQWTPQPAGVSV